MEPKQVQLAGKRVLPSMRRRPSRVYGAPAWTPAAQPRSNRKIPLRYVVVGVVLYCAVAWTTVIIGVQAGMHAITKQPESFAASTRQVSR